VFLQIVFSAASRPEITGELPIGRVRFAEPGLRTL